MSVSQIRRIAMALCAVIVVVAVLVSMRGVFGASPFGYTDEEKYTAGEAEISGSVRNLEIDWLNGRVTLARHSGDAIELRESSLKPIDEDMKLRWWLDGDTLRVQYARNGFRLTWNQEKELTVSIPEDIAFDEVSIRATSGDLDLADLKAGSLNLTVTSGDIKSTAEARKIVASATSGSVSLRTAGVVEAVSVGTTSGGVRVEAADADVIKATCTSGIILISADHVNTCEAGATSGSVTLDIGEAGQADISATSGTVYVKLSKFAALKARTTSGAITAELAQRPGFTAQIHTVSGSVDYDLALSREGDRYVCGDGSAKVELGSTSGNIRLSKDEREE